MFCEKCGNKLMEGAKFCTNCGNNTEKVGGTVRKIEIPDEEVKLRVKPTFNTLYMGFIWIIIVAIFVGLMLIFGFVLFPVMGTMTLILIALFAGMFAIVIAIPLISLIFKKFQYKHTEYNFYTNKVIYHDGFLNKAEKEVKYKYVREVLLQQSFFQRWFKLGTILLYTNIGSFTGGISIIDVENPEEVYKKIKEIAKM